MAHGVENGLRRYGNLINGVWQDAVQGEVLTLKNPSDGSDLALIARGTQADIDLAVASARNALSGAWGKLTATERGRILHKISEAVLREIDLLTVLEARDVGKPLTQARADVVALARYLEFYGALSERFHSTVCL